LEKLAMAKRPKGDKSWALAACTVAVAAAVAGPVIAAPETRTVRSLQNYCQSSWRNAGINRQEWCDCTQQAVTELIERISAERLTAAVQDNESLERRELNRAVWRIIQRWRRSPRVARFYDEPPSPAHHDRNSVEWTDISTAARECLSSRQLQILNMIRDGWRVPEIADNLEMTAARVSDEKYKAIRNLREAIRAERG
jgi:hypothetical protein